MDAKIKPIRCGRSAHSSALSHLRRTLASSRLASPMSVYQPVSVYMQSHRCRRDSDIAALLQHNVRVKPELLPWNQIREWVLPILEDAAEEVVLESASQSGLHPVAITVTAALKGLERLAFTQGSPFILVPL